MEIINPIAELVLSLAAIASLSLVAMIFSVLIAQLIYGLFED